MTLCSMFLKASVVRVRNPGWSQRPQKSLETLLGFRERQARLESSLAGSTSQKALLARGVQIRS